MTNEHTHYLLLCFQTFCDEKYSGDYSVNGVRILDFFTSTVFNRTTRRHLDAKAGYYGPVGRAPPQSTSSLDHLQEHSSKRVPLWSALAPPADVNPVDWQINFALDADSQVHRADTHPQTEDPMDQEDEISAPSNETEQASSSTAQQPSSKPMVSGINTFVDNGMYFFFS